MIKGDVLLLIIVVEVIVGVPTAFWPDDNNDVSLSLNEALSN